MFQQKTFNENLQVIALSGTVSPQYQHMHVLLSRSDGKTIGGRADVLVVSGSVEVVLLANYLEAYSGTYDQTVGNIVLQVQKVC